jgi:hypothetical protein
MAAGERLVLFLSADIGREAPSARSLAGFTTREPSWRQNMDTASVPPRFIYLLIDVANPMC